MDRQIRARQGDAAGQRMDIRPRGDHGGRGVTPAVSWLKGVTLEVPLLLRQTIHTLPDSRAEG